MRRGMERTLPWTLSGAIMLVLALGVPAKAQTPGTVILSVEAYDKLKEDAECSNRFIQEEVAREREERWKAESTARRVCVRYAHNLVRDRIYECAPEPKWTRQQAATFERECGKDLRETLMEYWTKQFGERYARDNAEAIDWFYPEKLTKIEERETKGRSWPDQRASRTT